MVALFTPPVLQAIDVNGNPYSGAKLYFYQTGTTTLITVYQDSGLATPHANPVVADASGQFAPIYVGSTEFKIVLTTSADVTIRTVDPVLMNATDTASQLTDLGIPQTASTFLQRNAGNTAFEAKTVKQVRENIRSGEFNTLDYGAAASNTTAQNKTAVEATFAACDAAGGGHVVNPWPIDFGFNKLDNSTRPNVGTLTNDITFFDYGVGDADGAGSKLGAHTRITYYTKQTDPQGMHDGDAFDISGLWHPHIWIDHIADYAAPNDPSRTTGDNRRARVWLGIKGAASWSIGQSTRSGAEFTDEELSNFVIEAYNTSIGTYAPLIIDRATGRWSIGNGTNTPPAQLHVRQASDFPITGMFESFGTRSVVALRNSNGSTQDIEIQNDSRAFKIHYSGVGDAFTIDTARNGQFNLNLNVVGALSKGSGTFDIAHPDPAKAEAHRLRHSFVESPTRGDNIYRFTVTVDGEATIDLPDYWPHLNENPQIWVNAAEGFGRAYGKIAEDYLSMRVFADTPGTYNVLLIGTRCDEVAKTNFDPLGVEYEVVAEG